MSRLSYSSRRVMSRRLITSAVKDVHEKQNKGFQWQILRRTIFLKNLVCKQMYCSFYYFVCFCEKCITRIPILKVVYITSSVMHVIFLTEKHYFEWGPGYYSDGSEIDSRWYHWIFQWHIPSDRTMALGSTQPLVKMSTRSISCGKGGRFVRLTTSTPSCAECHGNLGAKPPGNFWITPGLLGKPLSFHFL